jgi:hypothetical protein
MTGFIDTVYSPLSELFTYAAPFAKHVCMKYGYEYSEALSGWKQVGPTAKPIFNGIVVLEEDFETIDRICRQEEAKKDKIEAEKKTMRALSRWKRLVNVLLVQHAAHQRVASAWASGIQTVHSSGQASSETGIISTPVTVSCVFSFIAFSDFPLVIVTEEPARPEQDVPILSADGMSDDMDVQNPDLQNGRTEDAPHVHKFPQELWIADASDKAGSTWLKRCICGYSVAFERL